MGALGTNTITLLDHAKRHNPDGTVAELINLLSQKNPVTRTALYVEGNLPTGHRTTVVTALPTITSRIANKGVTPAKGQTMQVDEGCCRLEAMSKIDEMIMEINGTSASFRASEASLFAEAMNQTAAQKLFYGDKSTAPEDFDGLATRYNSSTGTNAQNIIHGGSVAASNTSIYLVGWGPRTVHGIFPKGTVAGMEHNDLGKQLVTDDTGIGGAQFLAWVDQFIWRLGLAVRDWRYAARICNLDPAELVADGGGSTVKLIELMLKAIHRMPDLETASFRFYTNRTVAEMLDIQCMNKANVFLKIGEEEGRPKLMMRGIPIEVCDQIVETESLVTGF